MSQRQLHDKSGEFYERWAAAMAIVAHREQVLAAISNEINSIG